MTWEEISKNLFEKRTAKRFTLQYINEEHVSANLYDGQTFVASICIGEELILELLNCLSKENEQLKNKSEDWRQRTFKAHKYFDILEKVIDEVCNDDISNQIWKEYGERERLIE